MKIRVKVQPGSKQQKVMATDEGKYKVYVTAAPEKGKANEMVQKLLADYFHVRARQVCIVKGEKAKEKLIEILKE